jgi:nucleotide-binding universal stress UspA family protein
MKRLFLGSVSEHVVRHAPCPVLVIRESNPD